MFRQTVIVLFATICSFEASPIGGRIVNGTDAQPGEFPYIVSLRFSNSHNCGGSLLNDQFVLTAAHCVSGYSVSALSVQYGVTTVESGLNAPNVVNVSKAVVHENYTVGGGYYNDVAVLKLQTPVTFDALIQPVKLPPAFNATPENSPAVLIGWGYNKSGGQLMSNLQKVDILVYSDDECERIHAKTGPTNREFNVCAGVPEGGKGQCSGDSGGPLLVDGIQVGTVSWSVKPCTVKGYPGVFSKVSRHVEWIKRQIAENS